MPRLQNFTDEQKAEIRREIAYYMRPLRIRFWGVIIGLLVGGTFGLYTYTTTNSRLDSRVCQAVAANRTELHGLILLSVAPQPGETAPERARARTFERRAISIIYRAGSLHCP